MNAETMVLIQFIGKQPKKRDSVRPGSGRFWPHPGAVVTVPAREKYSYLEHPGVWREITPEQLKEQMESAAAEKAMPLIETLPSLSIENLQRLGDAVAAEIALREASRPKAVKAKVPESPTKVDDIATTKDEASIRAYSQRINTIANVIKNDMDLREDTQATNGWPKAEAIQDRMGSLPTEDEIAEAMALLGIDALPPSTPTADDPSPEEIAAKQQARERAQIALGEVDDSDLATVREMASTFGIELKKTANLATARKTVKGALQKLALD